MRKSKNHHRVARSDVRVEKRQSGKLPETTAPMADLTVAQIKAHNKLPDLKIPKFLDRVGKKTRKQVDAERDALIARDKARSKTQSNLLARGVTSPAPKADNLTAADRKAIAELQQRSNEHKTAKTTARISKLKAAVSGDRKKMPLQGKDAVKAIHDESKVDVRRPRMRDKFTAAQQRTLETQRNAHNKAVAERLTPKTTKPAKGTTEWPKPGTKNAKLFEAALKSGKDGITWDALAKKIGWQRCSWTLKLICRRKKARLEERDGRVFVTQ